MSPAEFKILTAVGDGAKNFKRYWRRRQKILSAVGDSD
jgi:hypothetical protein